MFNLSYTKPCEIQGTLKLKRDPFYFGLGNYQDTEGLVWDVRMVVGNSDKSKAWVCARLAQGEYYSTAPWSSQAGFHEWLPYRVEVVKEEKKAAP
jgi:hypothetical protein